MNFKFRLVFRKAGQIKLRESLVSIVCSDHFRANGIVNGFKDVEAALSYGACFFVGSGSKYEFNAFLDHFGGLKGGVCAHDFSRVAVVVSIHGCIMLLGGIDRMLVRSAGHCRLKQAANRGLLHKYYVGFVRERKSALA
jgi:hypothetical protein